MRIENAGNWTTNFSLNITIIVMMEFNHFKKIHLQTLINIFMFIR